MAVLDCLDNLRKIPEAKLYHFAVGKKRISVYTNWGSLIRSSICQSLSLDLVAAVML